jgi:hypothetical protein
MISPPARDTSLLTPVLVERHRQRHPATLSRYWKQAREVARSVTPEQRSALAIPS